MQDILYALFAFNEGDVKQQAIAKIVASAQEQGKSRRKSAAYV